MVIHDSRNCDNEHLVSGAMLPGQAMALKIFCEGEYMGSDYVGSG